MAQFKACCRKSYGIGYRNGYTIGYSDGRQNRQWSEKVRYPLISFWLAVFGIACVGTGFVSMIRILGNL